MPGIGAFHPQIVHFAIALLVVGVLLRLVALSGRVQFASPAATTLIVLGALAASLAVQSGKDARGPVDRIPGVTEAVDEHESWGVRTRNLFLAVTALEVLTLLLASRARTQRLGRGVAMGSALLGVVGLFFLYSTGERGADVVYEYAGGVGTRSGNPEDVQRLLVAALYNGALADRAAGRNEDAARLLAELERRRPDDPAIRLLTIESMLRDHNDADAAIAALRGFAAGNDTTLRTRAALLRVDAFEALGQRDSSLVTIQELQREFPGDTAIQRRADTLK